MRARASGGPPSYSELPSRWQVSAKWKAAACAAKCFLESLRVSWSLAAIHKYATVVVRGEVSNSQQQVIVEATPLLLQAPRHITG
jgi:hypothetical protein